MCSLLGECFEPKQGSRMSVSGTPREEARLLSTLKNALEFDHHLDCRCYARGYMIEEDTKSAEGFTMFQMM